jgi:hypothetical protein
MDLLGLPAPEQRALDEDLGDVVDHGGRLDHFEAAHGDPWFRLRCL